MHSQIDLIQLQKGDSVDHFLLLKKSEIKVTKTNKEYWCMELGDKSISMLSNMWDNFSDQFSAVKSGDVVKVSGSIEEFNSNKQIKVFSVRSLLPDENFSAADFLAKSKRNLFEMKDEFEARINRINNSYLKELMKLIFNEENFNKFSLAPAGKSWHHSYIHGLLEHTLEIMKICDLMCDIHPEINRDLIISGAMLHDFGKIEELSFSSAFEYTDKGKLLGHIVISAMIINEEAKKITDFPEDLKTCLLHLILSHQGKLEHASPVVPKTLEAITLYHADELSAKANAYKNALNIEAKQDSKWTKFVGLASTDLFNHGLHHEAEEKLDKTLFD